MNCSYRKRCGFIDEISRQMPFTADRLQEKYCRVNSLSCVKNKIAKIMGIEQPPRECGKL